MLKRFAPPLTREGRDTLWLLAALALSLAPHWARLPLWCSLGTAVALLWRAGLAWRDSPLPPRWVLFVGLAVSIALTWWSHHGHFGREAGITFVTVLAALKTLELRARRDAFVVTCLGFFLVFTQFLYSQSIGMAMLMLLATWSLLSTLVLAQRPLGRPRIAEALKSAGVSLAWGLPLMLALYMFFPRFGPLWNLPSDAGSKTGLSDSLRLGQVSELALDDSIAMRVRFEGTPPRPQQMYFRGPVLTWFDGQNWSTRAVPFSLQSQPEAGPVVQSQGSRLRYEVTLEPTRLRSLPLLDGTLLAHPTPPLTQPEMRRWGLDWRTARPVMDRIQISAQATLGGARETSIEYHAGHTADMQLPEGYNPRTIAWAQALRREARFAHADAHTLSQHLLQHIRNAKFTYTLAPDDDAPGRDGLPERHLIDRFWLERRTGFCEHFATAYVVVMRAMGIPARVVTGFQGAELNQVDGLYVVRNSDAHAWAEFWQDGTGWVRVDPTAAVAPDRIDRTSGQRLNQGAGRILGGDTSAWLNTLRAYVDATNHRWNVWVLQYAREQQLSVLQNWGVSAHNWTDLLRICGLILAAGSLSGVAWLWWQRPRATHNPWERTMHQLHRALLTLDLPAPSVCPAPAPALVWRQHLHNLPRRPLPTDLQDILASLLTRIDALRYASPAPGDNAPLKEAQLLVKQIREHIRLYRRARPISGSKQPRTP